MEKSAKKLIGKTLVSLAAAGFLFGAGFLMKKSLDVSEIQKSTARETAGASWTTPEGVLRDYFNCYNNYVINNWNLSDEDRMSYILPVTDTNIIDIKQLVGNQRTNTFYCREMILKSNETSGNLKELYSNLQKKASPTLEKEWNKEVLMTIKRGYDDVEEAENDSRTLLVQKSLCRDSPCVTNLIRRISQESINSLIIGNDSRINSVLCEERGWPGEENMPNASEIERIISSLGNYNPGSVKVIPVRHPTCNCSRQYILINNKIVPFPSSSIHEILAESKKILRNDGMTSSNPVLSSDPREVLRDYFIQLQKKQAGQRVNLNSLEITPEKDMKLLNLIFAYQTKDEWERESLKCSASKEIRDSPESIDHDMYQIDMPKIAQKIEYPESQLKILVTSNPACKFLMIKKGNSWNVVPKIATYPYGGWINYK